LSQSTIYILEYCSSYLSVFVTNILCPFHISSKAPLPTHFARHILCCVFDQSSEIAIMFQNKQFDLFVVSRINYLHVY